MARDQGPGRVRIHENIEPSEAAGLTDAFRALFAPTSGGTDILGELVGHLPLVAVAWDANGVLTAARGTALDRIGLGSGELVGTSATAWGEASETVLERTRQGHADVFDIVDTFEDEPFRYRVYGVPDGDGGTFALAVDLTDALVAEHEVDTGRALLESAIEVSGAWMVVQDATGRVLSVNPTARAALGVDRGDPELRAALARLDPVHDDGSPYDPDELPVRIALRTGVAQRNVIVGLMLQGERRWMSVTSSPIELEGDQAVVTSFTDVTDRQPTHELLRDSDERFRLLAEEAPIGIFIVGAHGEMLYGNPAVAELAGRSLTEIREVGWEACTHPDDLQRLVEGAELDDLDLFRPVEYRVLRPDGTVRWVRSSGAILHDRSNEAIGLVGTAADITELREADARLRESEQRTRSILEMAAEGIVSCDERGVILDFNAAAERIFGYDSEDLIGRRRVFELFADADRDRISAHLDPHLVAAEPRIVGGGAQEASGRRRDGTVVPIDLAVTEVRTDGGLLCIAVIRDLTQQKAFEHELEHLATHDPLTGLPNRALFAAQLESALARADRQRRDLAVLFVDIDRVKLVTEALGHRAGDDLMVQAAERLRQTAGPTATLGRFSNDQFVAFIEELDDGGEAVQAAIAMIEAINEPFMVAADEAFVNASVGIAFAIDGIGDAETIVSNADVAMGRAKSSSISRYEVFDTEMRAWVEVQRRTEISLRHGIERNEFELFYQPVVELATSGVTGYEALVRWNHPTLGLLAPADFIPVAEESGLIVPLGEQILRDAIRQSAVWQAAVGVDARPRNVAINLSARQLATPDLARVVGAALDEFGTDPSSVTFEITETVLLHDVDTVVQTLDQLKHLGVHLSLDDFGTGYSSLTYLCRLPIDTVKVDRSFISQLGTGSRDASIVEMVVTMARTLQLDVVAEGVETEHQADVLRAWGCRYAQGFLFARPTPVAELA